MDRAALSPLSEPLSSNLPEASTQSLVELLEEAMVRHAHKTAISHRENQITYRELAQRSDVLAAIICDFYSSSNEARIPADTPIVLCCARGILQIVAAIAILKAGAAFVPVEPSCPRDRLSSILRDTGTTLVVADPGSLDFLRASFPTIDCIEASSDVAPRTPQRFRPVAPSDLAYVLYTSGTSGVPKGVMVEHRNVVHLVHAFGERLELCSSDIIGQLASLTFDASISEIFPALVFGAKLVVVDDEVRRDPLQLIEVLGREKITVATLLPSYLASIGLYFGSVPHLPYLSRLIVAGEACGADTANAWKTGRALFNGYGPTETTVCACLHPITGSSDATLLTHPLPRTYFQVVREDGKTASVGEKGELWIGGPGVARGYLNLPELTAKAFVQPLPDDSSQRMYRSGDWVSVEAPDILRFVGRIDDQIKIRGHRVELEEIRQALLRIDGLVQAAVVAVEQNGSLRLDAYYSSAAQLPESRLRRTLAQSLPEHMIPNRFEWLSQLPATETGKIDKLALALRDRGGYRTALASPRTPKQADLLGIWRRILGTRAFGIYDDFFECGGDSLLVVALAAEVQRSYGLRLEVAVFFRHRSIFDQVEAIRVHSANGHSLLRPFRRTGQRPPLFFVHPSLSDSELYAPMATCLSEEQPLYGIDSYNRHNSTQPEDNLQVLARHYVHALRSAAPTGPYYLGGYSAGGNLAVEMARQLEAAGEAVATIYLIDSACPERSTIDGEVPIDARDFLAYFGLRYCDDPTLLELAKAEIRLLYPSNSPTAIRGRLVLFKATRLLESKEPLQTALIEQLLMPRASKFSRWDGIAQEVCLFEIDADHEEIVSPTNLQTIAAMIERDIYKHASPCAYSRWS